MTKAREIAILNSVRRGFIRTLWIAGLFSLAVNLLMLAVPLYMLQIFDRVIASRSVETLLLLTLITAFALICQSVLDFSRSLVLMRLAAWLETHLGGHLLGAAVVRSLGSGQASAQGLRDLATVRGYVASPGIVPLFDAPWTPIYLGVLFLLDPLLGFLGIAAVAVLLCVTVVGDRLSRADLRRAGEVAMRANQETDHALANADAIQAMGMLPALIARWSTDNIDVATGFRRGMSRANLAVAASKMLRFSFQAAVYGVAAYLVLDGRLTPGGMIAAAILAGRALAPIDGATSAWRSGVQALEAWNRIKDILAGAPIARPALVLPRPSGRLELDQISYAYPGQPELQIGSVSLALKPGQSLAVIGPAASGKTTLARLIVGNLRPARGHVRLDGVEMSQWLPDDRGRHVGYLPQDIELFAATVAENIARLSRETEGVITAAQLVGAHDMIARLPRQYETPIGPRGMELSGGQRQLIGLARAVWGNPSLLVLDEPNSNLDQQGDSALTRALRALCERGTTTVLVTHRPSLVRLVDLVLVLRGGKVQMLGPAAEVIPKLMGLAQPRDADAKLRAS